MNDDPWMKPPKGEIARAAVRDCRGQVQLTLQHLNTGRDSEDRIRIGLRLSDKDTISTAFSLYAAREIHRQLGLMLEER